MITGGEEMFLMEHEDTKIKKRIGLWGEDTVDMDDIDRYKVVDVDLSLYGKHEVKVINAILNVFPNMYGVELLRFVVEEYTLGLLWAYIDNIGIDESLTKEKLAFTLDESDIYFDISNEISLGREAINCILYIPSELVEFFDYKAYGEKLKRSGYKIYSEYGIAVKFW